MKRAHSAAGPRPHPPVNPILPLETELMGSGQFDRRSTVHQAIWRLAACQPSTTFVQTWDGPDCIDLLMECDSQRWVLAFAHVATLFDVTALTDTTPCLSPELIAHLLVGCPQIVDLTLAEFCADAKHGPVLEAALSASRHLRHLDFAPEDVDPGVGLCIVRGLSSHHHLESWRHWTDDDPDEIVDALERTLPALRDLRSLDLWIDAPWSADHFERFACQLARMPALEELRLSLEAGCDLSHFFRVPADGALPVARLTLAFARASADAAQRTAAALVQGIATTRRLTSLCVSLHVFEAMDRQALIRAIERNGAFDTLTFLDPYDREFMRALPNELYAAMRTNRTRFELAPVGMMGPTCSAFVNVALAGHELGPVSDIGPVVAAHLVGQAAAPDLRDCQGLLRVSKRVWEAARDARRQAVLPMLELPSTGPAMALDRIHLIEVGRKFGILSLQEAERLTEKHSRRLT